ncbi:MAG: DUF420 domain-containing protein [Proteobacteria bacterium]|nr:DUF420 domain-containing protein [Pseudomonadota bacterium]
MREGFLGMGAPLSADINLTLQLLMGLALLCGMMLARRQRFKEHQYCQTAVVVLNFLLIVGIMLPAFRKQVAPRVAGGFQDPMLVIAFIHGLLGAAAELAAIYIVLVAGTNVVPESLRFRDYRPWMRTTLALWWAVIGLGVITYGLWYAPRPAAASKARAKAAAPAAGKASVAVKGFKFDPAELTIPPGTVVAWTGLDGKHTVESDDGSFKTEAAHVDGGTYEHRFDKPGVYRYSCEFHGDKGGKGMAGVIRVQ